MQCPLDSSHPQIEEHPTKPEQTVLNLIEHVITYDRDWTEAKIHWLIEEILPVPINR